MGANLTLAGNLTHAPELRVTPAGRSVVNLDVAVNDGYRGADGAWVERPPVFQRVVVWGDDAEVIAASCQRGDAVLVSGRLVDASYDKDGATVRRTALEARDVALVVNRRQRAVATRVQREAQSAVTPA